MAITTSINDTTDNTIAAASATSTTSGSSADDLSSSFLTLLVAQLKNQDPTNPMDNSQLTT